MSVLKRPCSSRGITFCICVCQEKALAQKDLSDAVPEKSDNHAAAVQALLDR